MNAPQHAVDAVGQIEARMHKVLDVQRSEYLAEGAVSAGRPGFLSTCSATARNLVPVKLELGGKSPVIISRSANLKTAAQRIMMGKILNAGQICLAPDYLMVPEEKLEETVEALKAVTADMYPTLLNNTDYTAVVNDRHFQRLQGYLD
jgi:acyl-CoA reductase-like NAD-dependent aldehyde dehydrogenase